MLLINIKRQTVHRSKVIDNHGNWLTNEYKQIVFDKQNKYFYAWNWRQFWRLFLLGSPKNSFFASNRATLQHWNFLRTSKVFGWREFWRSRRPRYCCSSLPLPSPPQTAISILLYGFTSIFENSRGILCALRSFPPPPLPKPLRMNSPPPEHRRGLYTKKMRCWCNFIPLPLTLLSHFFPCSHSNPRPNIFKFRFSSQIFGSHKNNIYQYQSNN